MTTTEHAPLAAAPAFTLTLTFDRRLVYDSLTGQRAYYLIKEGIVSGPRLSGQTVDDGGDWIVARPDNVAETETRTIIRADDGTMIYMRARGVIRTASNPVESLRTGKGLDTAGQYFRTAPWFDTPVGAHDWLTKSLFVGIGRLDGDRAVIDIHEIL